MTNTNISDRPYWIRDLTNDPLLCEEIAAHGPDAFLCASPYSTPSGEDLDRYVGTPGFEQYQEHEDGGLVTTPEMQYLMVGLIGTHNITSVSGGVVVPIRHGFDLPMPSGRYRVRIENDYGADAFVVSRIHIVDGEEHVEGSVSVYCDNVGELVHRAGCYVNWDEMEWTDASIS